MNTTPFATILSESRRGRTEFLDRWRVPALVIENAAGKRPTELDGRSPYPLRSSYKTPTRTTYAQGVPSDSKYPYLEFANIVWLEKSPRSAFTHIIALGRGADNDIRFDFEALSDVHATFARSGERWYVQDHNSKNGTFVNGERLGAGALRRLSDGDTIRFADAIQIRYFAPKALYDFLCIVRRVTPTLEASP